MSAENRLQVAKLKTQALILEADAEGAQANNLEAKRKHEQKMKLSEEMANLVGTNKIILSGKQGEELLNYFKDTTDLVNALDDK